MKEQGQQTSLAADSSPKVLLAQMSRLYVLSRAIHTVAELGIANLIGDAPVRIADIAANEKLDSGFLARLVRYLAAYGLFEETSPGCFRATEMSSLMRDDHPESMRPMLRMVTEEWWSAAGRLTDVVRSGDSGFSLVHGSPFFPFLRQHPQLQARFDDGMSAISRIDDRRLAAAYDFSPFRALVDLGGGKGHFLREILSSNDTVSGVLFDQPHVLAGCTTLDGLVESGRARLEPGNLFEELPPGADVYVTKGTLHDFDDSDAAAILRNCSRVMAKGSRLLIIEQLLPSDCRPHPNSTMDMVMMFLLGGRQRSLDEWRDLVEASSLRLVRAIPTDTNYTYLEASLPGSA